jgi:hypothetical protein
MLNMIEKNMNWRGYLSLVEKIPPLLFTDAAGSCGWGQGFGFGMYPIKRNRNFCSWISKKSESSQDRPVDLSTAEWSRFDSRQDKGTFLFSAIFTLVLGSTQSPTKRGSLTGDKVDGDLLTPCSLVRGQQRLGTTYLFDISYKLRYCVR